MPPHQDGEDPALTMLRAEMKRRVTASADLLKRFAYLTRAMQRLETELDAGILTAAQRRPKRAQQNDLRWERDDLKAEILRRMTTQRSPRDIPCRTCGAGINDRCYNLSDGAQNWGPQRGRHYHAARTQDAAR